MSKWITGREYLKKNKGSHPTKLLELVREGTPITTESGDEVWYGVEEIPHQHYVDLSRTMAQLDGLEVPEISCPGVETRNWLMVGIEKKFDLDMGRGAAIEFLKHCYIGKEGSDLPEFENLYVSKRKDPHRDHCREMCHKMALEMKTKDPTTTMLDIIVKFIDSPYGNNAKGEDWNDKTVRRWISELKKPPHNLIFPGGRPSKKIT